MILMIDNYDSFTYNIVQYLGEIGEELKVFRNDKIDIGTIEAMKPDRIVISPGPCTPNEAGISNDVIRHFMRKIPILGVCLGHQCIGFVLGAKIIRATRLMHGKTSMIYHEGKSIYDGLSNPFQATRYHSLVIDEDTLPDCLLITARSEQNELMGVRHREYPLEGVQFHPESILTPEGKQLLKNFVKFGIVNENQIHTGR